MINLFCSGFIMVLLLSGCGWDGTPTRNNDFIPLTSIEIVAVTSTIAAQTSTTLTAKGNFSGIFTRDITDQVTWSSDSPTVAAFATAASPNRVTGSSPGVAILTATMGSVSAAPLTLTVSSATVTALAISPQTPTIAKGLNTHFTASGTFSDNTTQDLTFDAVWASSDVTVATVSNDPGSKGFAQTLASGPSTISATFGGLTATTLLTVTVPVLQTITLVPANASILTVSSTSFQATGHFSDGSTADITSQVVWKSSNPAIATIASSGGVATTLSQGTTSISATLNGVSGASSLKVTGGTLTGISLSAANMSLVKGTVGRISATGTFSNGTSRDITGAVDWSTANTTLATVVTSGGNLALLNPLA
ncbi:MAG: Ig-like domain-containing protein, partial [Desulfuromonadaceae bacterium]|nr:Ig-like domain-containing protein [Desulfuromonadaceae bacterium]